MRATVHDQKYAGAPPTTEPPAPPPDVTLLGPRGPHTRLAVIGLALATIAIGAAYASAFLPGAASGGPSWTPWLLAVGVPTALVSVMSLGAARHGRVPGALLAAFLVVGATLVLGFALALSLPASGAAEPLLLGLPRRAAIVVYGIGLLPVLVLPVAYALTFEAQTLRDDDLARVMAAGAARRERDGAAR
jgi:hypothetical protein